MFLASSGLFRCLRCSPLSFDALRLFPFLPLFAFLPLFVYLPIHLPTQSLTHVLASSFAASQRTDIQKGPSSRRPRKGKHRGPRECSSPAAPLEKQVKGGGTLRPPPPEMRQTKTVPGHCTLLRHGRDHTTETAPLSTPFRRPSTGRKPRHDGTHRSETRHPPLQQQAAKRTRRPVPDRRTFSRSRRTPHNGPCIEELRCPPIPLRPCSCIAMQDLL